MLNRETLIRKSNPLFLKPDFRSPLTVGNGNLAFTADVTGLQTCFDDYLPYSPLVTQTNFLWHSFLNKEGDIYTLSDLDETEYEFSCKRKVHYPTLSDDKNKEIYTWLRENPHRLNAFRIRLFLDGKLVKLKQISDIRQSLDMYTGILTSKFSLAGETVTVTTAVGKSDTLGVKIESALCKRNLSTVMDFPYASPEKSASDFGNVDKHNTKLTKSGSLNYIERSLDATKYFVLIYGNVRAENTKIHEITVESLKEQSISFTVSLALEKDRLMPVGFKQVVEESELRFYTYWHTGAFIDVTDSEDERARELERRIISSLYLLAVNDCGSLPPSETGLSCNSWYGKFHLEMHPIHMAFLPLYGRGYLLEKSLGWYADNLNRAIDNARKNGFKGARWPKMTGPSCENSPSEIAPLLIWQQPHVIYMLSLLRESRYREDRVEVPLETEKDFLFRYKDLIYETALFMADYLQKEENTYSLLPPLFSVQEKGDPLKIKNPPFEIIYFSFALKKAYEWMLELGEDYKDWLEKAENTASVSIENGLLQAYEGYEDTYTKLNLDHPAHIFIHGFLRTDVDEKVLLSSLKKFDETWDFNTLWGWDFAFLAMTYARLGLYEEAFDILLKETNKNTYVASGNNAQFSESRLPLYLPGNGSLLLAMSMLKSCKGWYVKTEGIMEYPF